jgi:L-alanine-DL-glutamate epimerase-like enolase superfamily enzyme
MTLRLSLHHEDWPLSKPFRITGWVWDSFPAIVVELCDGRHVGRGEGEGIYYRDETPAVMAAQVESVAGRIEAGAGRLDLLDLLPPGGARNAVDAALWDLEAKRSGRRVWELAFLAPRPLTTVMTIGIEETPEAMAAKAAAMAAHALLKVKLDDYEPVRRLEAIRAARPDARLVVDANQGWTFAQLCEVAPRLRELGVEMIEQPLPRGGDEALEGYESPVPLSGDESCVDITELDAAARRYAMINIKLDKCGGLTAGLQLAAGARERGLGLMVGNMGGSSLAMAPAFVLGLACDFHDLDGPLLLRRDRPFGLTYDHGVVEPPDARLWG